MSSPWQLICALLTVPWGQEGAEDMAIDAMVAMRDAYDLALERACHLPLVLLAPFDICPSCGVPACFHRNYPKKGTVNYERQRHEMSARGIYGD